MYEFYFCIDFTLIFFILLSLKENIINKFYGGVKIMSELLLKIFFLILHISGQGSFPKPLTQEEESYHLEKMKSGDMQSRNILIEKNLRLVAHIVKKYYAASEEQDDLISIGTIGLIKAVDSFDNGKKTKLSTYAARCIENEILMYFRSKKKTAGDVSINEHIDEDKDGNALLLMDIISEDDHIIDTIFNNIKTEAMLSAIENDLPDRERKIILLRYGLSEPALTQKETALRLGISRSYVSRLEKKALMTLRDKLKKNM